MHAVLVHFNQYCIEILSTGQQLLMWVGSVATLQIWVLAVGKLVSIMGGILVWSLLKIVPLLWDFAGLSPGRIEVYMADSTLGTVRR